MPRGAGTPALELTLLVLVNISVISQLFTVSGHCLASGNDEAKLAH